MGSIIYKVATEEMQAAMRLALGKAFDGLDVPDDIANAVSDAIEGFDDALVYTMENPCGCSAGARCPYRGVPSGNPDVEHCGTWMPTDPGIAVGERVSCPGCETEYVVGDPEEG